MEITLVYITILNKYIHIQAWLLRPLKYLEQSIKSYRYFMLCYFDIYNGICGYYLCNGICGYYLCNGICGYYLCNDHSISKYQNNMTVNPILPH